jgi:hypothetical protein
MRFFWGPLTCAIGTHVLLEETKISVAIPLLRAMILPSRTRHFSTWSGGRRRRM